MVSELERKRLENIERNKKALREFQLREAASLAFKDDSSRTNSKPKLGVSKKKVKKPVQPVRVRNLRRHGISEEDKKLLLQTTDEPRKMEIKHETRKEGELKAKDLIENAQYEQAREVMKQFSDMSAGDLFSMPTEKKSGTEKEDLDELKHEFAALVPDERNIKVVPERVTAICFHPSNQKKIVFAGDKVGNIGLWDTQLPEDEGLISFSFHTRNITNVCVDQLRPNRVYTASHDQSIRVLDLQSQVSQEVCVLNGGEENGITDFHFASDNNLVYYTTLAGELGRQDIRLKPKQQFEPVVLSFKKIGGFAINPLNEFQVATGSLDRTMKIFDLRNVKKETPDEYGAEVLAVYNSRLSISSTSWNQKNQIVCNGYDNTVNIFNMDTYPYPKQESSELSEFGKDNEIKPDITLQHNCQTGRWVSILKARWQEDPKDGIQKFVIGNMKRYADIFAGTGAQIAHLDSDQMTAVPAVSQLHRSENWVAGGNSSGKVYMWTPPDVKEEA